MRRVFLRADRLGAKLRRPDDALPCTLIRQDDGWCDDACDGNYNRFVRHPYRASAEHLWRGDGLYDIVVVLGHNDRPRIKGHGSAIFLHCAAPGFSPTAGCVALRREHLARLLPALTNRTMLAAGIGSRRKWPSRK